MTQIKRCEGLVKIRKQSSIRVTIDEFNSFNFKVVTLYNEKKFVREIKFSSLKEALATDLALIIKIDDDLRINITLYEYENEFTELRDKLCKYFILKIEDFDFIDDSYSEKPLLEEEEVWHKQLKGVIAKKLMGMETSIIKGIFELILGKSKEKSIYEGYIELMKGIITEFFNIALSNSEQAQKVIAQFLITIQNSLQSIKL